jgi:hypothetical protein
LALLLVLLLVLLLALLLALLQVRILLLLLLLLLVPGQCHLCSQGQLLLGLLQLGLHEHVSVWARGCDLPF